MNKRLCLTLALRVQKLAPIFFSRRDLDVALNSAHATQQGAQVAAYAKRADEAHAAYEAAVKEYSAADGESAKAAARAKVEKAQDEEERFREKAKQITNAQLPKVPPTPGTCRAPLRCRQQSGPCRCCSCSR